jgi:hypothetical protein
MKVFIESPARADISFASMQLERRRSVVVGFKDG